MYLGVAVFVLCLALSCKTDMSPAPVPALEEVQEAVSTGQLKEELTARGYETFDYVPGAWLLKCTPGGLQEVFR